MKKFFNLILTYLLIYFSFYYTNMVSNYLKNKDPIMIKIKNEKNKYYQEPTDAIIENETIIPGISGYEVDISKSYMNMKKLNEYQESMLVFNKIEPNISLKNNQDKVIISGNKDYFKVSILLKIDDINILKKIIKNKEFTNISYILSSNFIKENYNYLKELNKNIVVDENDNLLFLNIFNYCYKTKLNDDNKCSNFNKYTILTKMITYDYYYNTTKLIDNGSILAYNCINDKNLNEITIVLNGIKSLGYEIVSLDNLLNE